MGNNIILFDTPELKQINKSKAVQIRNVFEPMAVMLQNFEGSYDEILSAATKGITKEVQTKAKRLRLNIAKIRIETEKIRKIQKQDYLIAGKAIDGVSNILKWAIQEKEKNLKDIENYYEIQERKRLAKLQEERAEKLSKYVEDANERVLSTLKEDEFQALLMMKKQQYEDNKAAELKAEKERIAKEKAEAEEKAKLKAENEKLKKEAEERNRLQRIADNKRKQEEQKRKLAYEKQLQKEAEEKAKLKAELHAKEIAEKKAKEEEKERIEKELNKGDEEKVKDLLNELKHLQGKYIFKSRKNKKMYSTVVKYLDQIISFIKQ